MRKIATDTKHVVVFSLKLIIIIALATTLMLMSITKLNLHDNEPLLHFYQVAEFNGSEVLIFISFIGTIFLILFSIFVLLTDMFLGTFAMSTILIFFCSITPNVLAYNAYTITISIVLFVVCSLSIAIKYIEYLLLDVSKSK